MITVINSKKYKHLSPQNNVRNTENINVFEELVSETDTEKIKNESTDELAECSDYEMLVCVSELERERKNNVDLFYEYLSMMNEFSLYGYNTQNSHLCGKTIERCYVKPRLIWNDGG